MRAKIGGGGSSGLELMAKETGERATRRRPSVVTWLIPAAHDHRRGSALRMKVSEVLLTALVAVTLTGSAIAQAPTTPPPDTAAPPGAAPPPAPSPFAEPVPAAALAPDQAPPPAAPSVDVQPLAALDLFSAGRDTGLRSDLWKGSSAALARVVIPTLVDHAAVAGRRGPGPSRARRRRGGAGGRGRGRRPGRGPGACPAGARRRRRAPA